MINPCGIVAKNVLAGQHGVRPLYRILKLLVLIISYNIQNFIKIELYFTEIWRYNDLKDIAIADIVNFHSLKFVAYNVRQSVIVVSFTSWNEI